MFSRSALFVFALVAFFGPATLRANNPAPDSSKTDPLWQAPSFLTQSIDAEEKPEIHGYMETQIKTAHITPRGLIIADHGVEVQPAAGLIFNLYEGDGWLTRATFTAGIWNSVNTSLDIPNAGGWFEIDYLARAAFVIEKRVNVSIQYVAFDSPGAQFQTDNNIETTVSFDDGGMLCEGFGFVPYVRLFYNARGSSTVLLGRNGNTYDVELGFVPRYVWKSPANCPVTLTMPTYVTVGPKNFWGGSQNVGIATTSLAASVPLKFIPARFGYWHADASVAYFNLLNGKLGDASQTLGCGRDRNRVVGEFGIGVEF